jgi:hypothetical protein
METVIALRASQTASSVESTCRRVSSHTLRLHLTRTQYLRLGRFAIYQEYMTDGRLAHQSIPKKAALDEYLDRHSRPLPDQ